MWRPVLAQFNRPLKEFLAVQSKNSGRMEMRRTTVSVTESAKPAPFIRKT